MIYIYWRNTNYSWRLSIFKLCTFIGYDKSVNHIIFGSWGQCRIHVYRHIAKECRFLEPLLIFRKKAKLFVFEELFLHACLVVNVIPESIVLLRCYV